ncbi:MAG: hypothetical protein IPG90_03960 [Bacteroidetes bacterium]|nr:hypothetical protein [Bacteroidota bacterium]
MVILLCVLSQSEYNVLRRVVGQQSTDGGMTRNQITDWWNSVLISKTCRPSTTFAGIRLVRNDLYFSNDGPELSVP